MVIWIECNFEKNLSNPRLKKKRANLKRSSPGIFIAEVLLIFSFEWRNVANKTQDFIQMLVPQLQ